MDKDAKEVSVYHTYEPHHEKIGLMGFEQGLTQTSLYSLRKRIEA